MAAKAVKGAIAKKRESRKPQVKPKAVIKKPKALIEHVESNYSRSAKGFQLVRQQMQAIHELDKARFAGKPVFSADSGLRRLQPLI